MFHKNKNIELCITGHQDGDETGRDCGGSCKSCGKNHYNIANLDSLIPHKNKNYIDNSILRSCLGTCTDGIQNDDEKGIDCGGRCDACLGKHFHNLFVGLYFKIFCC